MKTVICSCILLYSGLFTGELYNTYTESNHYLVAVYNIQRFNAVLLHDVFPSEDHPD